MRWQTFATAAATAGFIIFLGWLVFSPEHKGWSHNGRIMGTSFVVRTRACQKDGCTELAATIDSRLAELESRLSHYNPEAELAEFNTQRDTEWVPVSADLAFVVHYALQVSQESGGAFDVTVAPAVAAWGFGPQPAAAQPDEDAVAAARELTDYSRIEVRLEPAALRKQLPELSIDLSAIAKGYAVDQIALLLEDRGINDYLVEIGGEVRTAGVRADGRPWHIGLEIPDQGPDIDYVVLPGDRAVATSGDYRNFYLLDNRRISHTINPHTAKPVSHQLASVSVIMPSAMQADAHATLLMVLGPELALQYAETEGIAALFQVRGPQGIATFYSSAMEAYLLKI